MTRNVVAITASGPVGCGKSAVLGEIEIALKAIGLDVVWAGGDQEKRLTHADWQHDLDMYQPRVVLTEIYPMDYARIIEDEIASKARQADVAVTYALAMRSAAASVWIADWPRVNKAILDRWSMTGLKRVKKLAHQKHREMPT